MNKAAGDAPYSTKNLTGLTSRLVHPARWRGRGV